MTLVAISVGLSSCGAKTSEEKEQIDSTINGLEPGAKYQTSIDGWHYSITIYKDGSSTSTGGDGSWFIESIHDQPFVVIYLDEGGDLYIDKNLKLHPTSASYRGYQLERINYIPDDAKGMTVGKKYTLPKFRWGENAYLTLNEDGTVTSEFQNEPLALTNWRKVGVEGKEWIMVYLTDTEGVYGYIVSPSLEYYSFSPYDNDINYKNEKLNLGKYWKSNREGRLTE